ncbi:tyrosine-type recombinase/integrase [Shimia sp.]|uniref:tyrosine-type recombinase/integrase n=1 Tax=Shimia sp. TaxID=1954381 RepID=UPI003297E39B
MASVYEKGDGKWTAAMRVPCPAGTLRADGSPVLIRKNKILTAKTKKAAERIAAKMEQDARDTPVVVQTEGSLAWYLNGVFIPHQRSTKAIKTAHRDAQLAGGVLRVLDGDMKLSAVGKADFVALVDRIGTETHPAGHPKAGQARYGARSVHHHWGFFKKAIAHAYDTDLISFNPRVEGLKAPKVPKRGPNVKYAGADETMVLVDALRHGHEKLRGQRPDMADLIEFGFLTACRRQEMLGLRWCNVHLETTTPFVLIIDVIEEAGGVYRLRTGTKTDAKTGQAGRRAYLVPEAVTLLDRRCGAKLGPNMNPDDLVFPNPKKGGIWRPSMVSSSVAEAAKRVGVTGGLHSRRHGGITHLLEQGVPLDVVSKHAGHADTSMTETAYGWVTSDMAQQQIAQIGAGLSGVKPAPGPDGSVDPAVQKLALEYAMKTGEPLEKVLAALKAA